MSGTFLIGTRHCAARCGVGFLALAWSTLAPNGPITAQATTGTIVGVAKSEGEGIPIPFALVRLVVTDSPATNIGQSITNSTGRFYFASVPPGSYRLQFLRIGFRPVLSAAFQVPAGGKSEQELRASLVGVPLATVRVYARGTCLNGNQVATDPYWSALWEDIRKGVELRRAFQLRYRYKRELSNRNETLVSAVSTGLNQTTDTILSEPDSVRKYEVRRRPCGATHGYGKRNCFAYPTDRELIDDEFLREHCIVAEVLDSSGVTGVQFRPSVKSKDDYLIRGTIWVDGDTRLMRRLEYEHLNEDKPISKITMLYDDIPVAGTEFRLLVSNAHWIHPPLQPRGTTATGTSSLKYWDFVDVRPQ